MRVTNSITVVIGMELGVPWTCAFGGGATFFRKMHGGRQTAVFQYLTKPR